MLSEFWVDWLKSKIVEYNEYLKSLNKNKISLKELNEKSNVFLLEFALERTYLRTYICSDEKIWQEWYELCRNDFVLWVLLDGTTKDINRNPKTKVQPIIPYYHQLPLIQSILDEDHNLHVEKTRRQGASLWISVLYSAWELIFGEQRLNFTTHKDKPSLWRKEDEVDSAFGKIGFVFSNSIFFNAKFLSVSPTFQDVRYKYRDNVLAGEILSPNTAVGFQANNAMIDEIDPVCEKFPNQAYKLTSGFASSVNRILFYSTYRSSEYPFYQIKETHDDQIFNFIVLDWEDHPLCNEEWFNRECAKLNYDPVLIARELKHNPRQAIKGRVFDLYSSENDLVGFKPGKDWKKIIFADFGGGTSATAFILAYYSTSEKSLYLDKALKTTRMDGKQIKKYLQDSGFDGVSVVGDMSALSQPSFKDSDWASELRRNGIRFIPVNNRAMGSVRQQVNLMFESKEIWVNKNSLELRDLSTYKWKGEDIDKSGTGGSHIGDALCYGCRYLYIRDSGEIRQG